MRGNANILVIGSAALGDAVARALPRCRSVTAQAPLSGLWTLGHGKFDGVVISLAAGQGALRAIRSLRQVAPGTRIVATCPPADEPQARAALRAGADDYVLEPVQPEDLSQALEYAAPPRYVVSNGAVPSVHEIAELSAVLEHLDEGLPATLERLARLLQNAFGAAGASVSLDEHAATAGEPEPPVLQEALRRRAAVVGQVALGRRLDATYTTGDAAHLADYARLIETIMLQAAEQARWQELAWRDDLSGLRNRRYFDATLDQLLETATARRGRLTVILFDIDDFKSYNDKYGHDTGDALIREVAILLTRCSREHDVVARYGGDEFAVILWDAEEPRVPGSQHPTEPIALAERFRQVIREHDFKCLGSHSPGPVTISGGLACLPWDGKTRAELMRAADEALLTAKRDGKNRIALAEEVRAVPPTAPDHEPPPSADTTPPTDSPDPDPDPG